MSKLNHDLMEYGYVEGTTFEGLMPKVAEKIGTVGASDVSVHMHGFMAKGVDALEVIDVEKVYDSESSSTEGTETPTENSEEGTDTPTENPEESTEN